MKSGTPKLVEVLEAISDNLSFNILDMLDKNEQTIKGLGEKLNISNKQCYVRIVKFLDTGLIKRKGMNYVITSFGQLIFEAQLKVARATQSLSKLKMLDSVRNSEITRHKYAMLIQKLIEDEGIKKIILIRSTDRV